MSTLEWAMRVMVSVDMRVLLCRSKSLPMPMMKRKAYKLSGARLPCSEEGSLASLVRLERIRLPFLVHELRKRQRTLSKQVRERHLQRRKAKLKSGGEGHVRHHPMAIEKQGRAFSPQQ